MGILPPLDFIEADDARRRPLRVAVTPLPSLFVALGDAIGHGRNGTPHAWRDAIRVHLKAQDRDTLAPLLTRGRTLVPDSLVGCAADVLCGRTLYRAFARGGAWAWWVLWFGCARTPSLISVRHPGCGSAT
jgi:hypothetical protein